MFRAAPLSGSSRPGSLPGVLAALAALLVLLFPGPASAQGLLIPRPISPPVPGRPILPAPPPPPLSVKSQHVSLQVTDGAMKVEVEQVFYNPHGVQMEGTYLFALPPGATVSSFRMTVDKEPVEGKLLGVEEARRIYESYVRRNIDPAILEYVGRNAFQARVFPIPPHSEKRVYLVYSQALTFQNGLYQAVYPLRSERVTGAGAGDLTVDCTLRASQPVRAIYSPTHEVQVKREGEHRARVTFEGKDVRADRDFVLYYGLSEKAFGLNALAHRRPGEDGYVMLMLAPRRETAASDVQPKDVVFVFDTSGSMQGAKIEQARKALQTVLGALGDRDRFNIIRFSSDVTPFREGVVPASAENRAAARAFVEEFKAIGGTAIDDAVQAGLAALPRPEARQGRGAFLVFMTDGLPTIGVTDPDRILQSAAKAAPPDVRLFSFGVGTDVNTLLLDRLARDHRGASDYISPNEDLETRIGSFYAKIAEPVLSNVQVELDGARLTELQPSRTPDLFAGTQLLLLGRYQGQGSVRLTLSGELNGRPQRFRYDLSLPERELGHDFVPRLWASRKIGFLLEEIRLRGESKELKDEVIRLSKEHGIVTPYTAYLVEEPGLIPAPAGAVRLGVEPAVPGGNLGGGFGGRGGAPGPSGPVAGRVREEQARKAQLYRQQADGFDRNSGANAVEASRRLRQLQERAVDEQEVEAVRQVSDRAFRFSAGQWQDQTAPAKPVVVPVRYGSEAYFQVLRARAEWAKFLALGRQVAFRTGKQTVVSVGEKGKETLTAAELKDLEK